LYRVWAADKVVYGPVNLPVIMEWIMGPGDFFREIALLDHAPRSADVLANQESVLLKISSEAFGRLRQ
jgi:CRP-like cAMP-binding protein